MKKLPTKCNAAAAAAAAAVILLIALADLLPTSTVS